MLFLEKSIIIFSRKEPHLNCKGYNIFIKYVIFSLMYTFYYLCVINMVLSKNISSIEGYYTSKDYVSPTLSIINYN